MANPAPAADIEWVPGDSGEAPLIVISGEITRGDRAAFDAAVDRGGQPIIFLDSPGGSVAEALEIGQRVQHDGLATVVAGRDECLSACALIWVAGDTRYLAVGGRLGAHAAYIDDGAALRASGIGNAEIGAYLARLGLSDAAVRYFTVSDPDEMMYLTPDLARIVGIDLVVLGADGVASDPSPPPPAAEPEMGLPQAAESAAATAAAILHLGSTCASLFAPEKSSLLAGIDGLSVWWDRPGFDLLVSSADSQLRALVARDGSLAVCIDVEDALRRDGQPTGIDGPSFRCPPGQTPTELAICHDPNLWAPDRAMNAVYLRVRNHPDAVLRKRVLAGQRAWMQQRDACGSDGHCLLASYRTRLLYFRDF